MSKRMIIMLGAIVIFFVAIASFKYFQIKAAIAQGSSWQPPPEAVTTFVRAVLLVLVRFGGSDQCRILGDRHQLHPALRAGAGFGVGDLRVHGAGVGD